MPTTSDLGYLIGPGQIQYVGGEIGEHEVVVDRRNLIESRFPKLALHIVFIDKAVAAVRVKTDIGCLPTCFGGE